MTDKLVLVLYVDIHGVPDEHVPGYVQSVSQGLFPENLLPSLDATAFVIPRIGGGTALECIHPKFILDQDVYKDYRLKTDQLLEHLDHFNKQK